MRYYVFQTVFCMLGLLYGLETQAQLTGVYGQYFEYMGYINPSYAGYMPGTTFTGSYRFMNPKNQLFNQTVNVAADISLDNRRSGLGFTVSDDIIGYEGAFSAYANYAHRLDLGGNGEDNYLSFGLGAGVIQHRLNSSKFIMKHPDDPIVTTMDQNLTVPDVKIGISYITNVFYIGFAAEHLLGKYLNYAQSPDIMITVYNPQVYLNGALNIEVGDNHVLRPRVAVLSELKTMSALDGGVYFLMEDLMALSFDYRRYLDGKVEVADAHSNRIMFGINYYSGTGFRFGFNVDYLFNLNHAIVDNYAKIGYSLSLLYNLDRYNTLYYYKNRKAQPKYF